VHLICSEASKLLLRKNQVVKISVLEVIEVVNSHLLCSMNCSLHGMNR